MYDNLSNRWYAHIPAEIKPEVVKVNHPTLTKIGSVDLGICNITTLYVPDEQPVIYSGRAVLSDWVYHTKKIARMQSQLPEKRHTSTMIRKLFRKRQRRFRHAIKTMLQDMFNRLQAMKVTNLIVGDLNGIRDRANHGKVNNQKLHNFWSHDSIVRRIKELGEEYNIHTGNRSL
jgi:putative transposase